jgi:hypothetical protein
LAAAVALGRLVQSQLFGLSPWDPATLALAAAGAAAHRERLSPYPALAKKKGTVE